MKCYRCNPIKNRTFLVTIDGNMFHTRLEFAKDNITRIQTKHGLIPCPVCNGRGYIKIVRKGGQ